MYGGRHSLRGCCLKRVTAHLTHLTHLNLVVCSSSSHEPDSCLTDEALFPLQIVLKPTKKPRSSKVGGTLIVVIMGTRGLHIVRYRGRS